MLLPITLTFAAACALLNLWLAIRCARFRIRDKILHGDAGHGLLARRMRAHANFIEYTPIALLLILVLDLNEQHGWLLALTAAVFLLGRVLHAIGMQADKSSKPRMAGMMMTCCPMRSGSYGRRSSPLASSSCASALRHCGVGHIGVALPLLPERAGRSVAGHECHAIAQWPKFLGYRIEQVLMVAHGEIGAPDAALEQDVPNEGEIGRPVEKHHVAGRVAGAMENFHRHLTKTDGIAIVQPA